jgi:hypothetical protein
LTYVLICLFFGLLGGLIGKAKGSSFFLWFLISGILPVAGVIGAMLYRWERDELRRQCPNCGNVVRLHDQVCMRCSEELYFPDVAITSESAQAPR